MVSDLASLSAGASATVVEVQGGRGLQQKLDAMGVRPGKVVKKVSSQLMAGPVTVEIGGRQVAMGHGIAKRVMVDTGQGETEPKGRRR